jgi:hypothetical protein
LVCKNSMNVSISANADGGRFRNFIRIYGRNSGSSPGNSIPDKSNNSRTSNPNPDANRNNNAGFGTCDPDSIRHIVDCEQPTNAAACRDDKPNARRRLSIRTPNLFSCTTINSIDTPTTTGNQPADRETSPIFLIVSHHDSSLNTNVKTTTNDHHQYNLEHRTLKRNNWSRQ